MTTKRKTYLTLAGLAILAALATWVAIPQHPSLTIGSFHRDLNLKLGLDLQGGAHLVYRANIADIPAEELDSALAGVRDVIERRVNAFGVAEPIVQTNRVGDEYRVIVELAGVFDANRAIALIGATPQLDFRRELTPETTAVPNIEGDPAVVGPVFERTDLSGKNLDRATVSFDSLTNTPQVNLEFDGDGTKLFAQLTRASVGSRIAIYLDGVPISAPVVQTEITNGQAVISGGFTLPEARELAQRLTAGALPVPIELIGQQTIGPALGRVAIERSVVAGIIGFIAVVTWMITFYRLPGLLASLALVLYLALFIAVIKLLPVTLTLAGIAGIILTIGMAVDANVLIFERFRENIAAGRTLGYALDNGFQEAWTSIRTSNVSSLLTALILYGFGTSIIRGFALTFALGIVLSMFTAIVITRTLLTLALRFPQTHHPHLLAAHPPKDTA